MSLWGALVLQGGVIFIPSLVTAIVGGMMADDGEANGPRWARLGLIGIGLALVMFSLGIWTAVR